MCRWLFRVFLCSKQALVNNDPAQIVKEQNDVRANCQVTNEAEQRTCKQAPKYWHWKTESSGVRESAKRAHELKGEPTASGVLSCLLFPCWPCWKFPLELGGKEEKAQIEFLLPFFVQYVDTLHLFLSFLSCSPTFLAWMIYLPAFFSSFCCSWAGWVCLSASLGYLLLPCS